ncbi:MAG TPA: GyrI-like domain-containing protein [Acidimicrobiales bacterium]|nr:GyrI-like domain-containing protein [Acidimicrobiales bacterium]
MDHAIDLVTVPSRTVAVSRFHVAGEELGTIGDRIGAVFGAVFAHLERSGASPEGPAIACYERAGDGFDVSAGFPVAEPIEPAGDVAPAVVGGCEVVHTTHLGPYDQLPAAYEALRRGAAERGRALAEDAPMWEEYWSGPDEPPASTRTEVFWPVVPA